ncbi:MAG: DUF1501 domain-containing protein [Cytophagales bacterium]
MERREFVKKMPILGALPFMLNGVPFRVMGDPMDLLALAANCDNDRVLVLIQLHGGNDGVNTVIPVADYDRYYNARPNVAIPDSGSRKMILLDSTLPVNRQVGLHPDMTGMKNLYDQGKLAIVQGVSYENHNGSHFRGRDVMFMGGGANDYISSGWVGRYLMDYYAPKSYPDDFPNTSMPDPLALEFGNEVSLVFHQGDNVPTSISIYNPNQFFNLVDGLVGFGEIEGIDPRGIPPEAMNGTAYKKEMDYILGLEKKTEEYHTQILSRYNAGKANSPNVVYPTTYPLNAPARVRNNPLSAQLQIIANLISGGSKTKIYLVKIGGFDTHVSQVETFNSTMGNHAALLYHISSAMNSFQQDLKARGIEDKVLSVTTSEFGRRVYSNGSFGTDHGHAAPIFVFGSMVEPGITGENPDMNKENVEMQYDYRQVYSTILKKWFCVDENKADELMVGDYEGKGQVLPLINNRELSLSKHFKNKLNAFVSIEPNPAQNFTDMVFRVNAVGTATITLFNNSGSVVHGFPILVETVFGENKVRLELKDIKSGLYMCQIKCGQLNESRKLVIQ